MIAALTPLPVFGVPMESKALKGMDSLLSIVQMPAGIPVGTLAIGEAGATNAALLAAAVLALTDPAVARALDDWRHRQTPRWATPRNPRPDRPGRSMASSADTGQRIQPGSTIGILGGGQLGRMAAMAAARLGYRCHILPSAIARFRRRGRPPSRPMRTRRR